MDNVFHTSDSDLPQPLYSEMCALTLAAVHSMGSLADDYLAKESLRPRYSIPKVRELDNGWPFLVRPQLTPLADSPTNYKALFDIQAGPRAPIPLESIAEFRTLSDFIQSTGEIRERLALKVSDEHSESTQRMLIDEISDLPLSILDRARAIGATTDRQLTDLYLHRERAWMVDPLPVEYVIPLALTPFGLDVPFFIDEKTRIEPIDEATQQARTPSDFSSTAVPDRVIGAATHALVLSRHTISNPGPVKRVFQAKGDYLSLLDEADLICHALQITTGRDAGYAQVLERPLGWSDRWQHDLPVLSTVATVRHYPDRFDDPSWEQIPKPADVEPITDEVTELRTIVPALKTAPNTVKLAARRLGLARSKSDEDDKTVDACIGLEALLGDGHSELVHRLALRASTVLGTLEIDPWDASMIYEIVKKIYSHRSAVVHGVANDKNKRLKLRGETYTTSVVAIYLLQMLIADCLRRNWTPKELDQILLSLIKSP